jgi:hypothetical protein
MSRSVRRMNTLPLWLQITGLVVAALSGIVGTVLGVLNMFLRWRDTRPRLVLEAKEEPTEHRQDLELIVRNKGRVAVSVVDLYLKITHPTKGGIDEHDPFISSREEFPFRLEPGDQERFVVELSIMSWQSERRGLEDHHTVVATVVDGLNNRYASKSHS